MITLLSEWAEEHQPLDINFAQYWLNVSQFGERYILRKLFF